MTANQPVWLLDVDGVINANSPQWGEKPAEVTAYAHDYGYTLRYAPSLVARIRALIETGTVDVRWCTTWCDDASELERVWDLPALPRAFSGAGRWVSLAKSSAALGVIEDGRHLIWTDDMETPVKGETAYDRLMAGGNSLLIRPRASVGLTPKHMTAIERFAAGAR